MKSDQDLYKQLRDLPKQLLWTQEVARFDAASPRERMEGVALIRAVGMIFSRFGTDEEKEAVRAWLITLLKDPQEKIRRYALAALPKIGAGEEGEMEMLSLLKEGAQEREKKHLGRALEKVGGVATLAVIEERGGSLPGITELKVKAAVSRRENPGAIKMEALLPLEDGMRIFLRCRKGLEGFVLEEAEEVLSSDVFDIEHMEPGCVTFRPKKPFSLAMLYKLRCFATVGFSLGTVDAGPSAQSDIQKSRWVESLARCIGSTYARSIMLAGTEGAARYRLEFAGLGHQRGMVRQVIDRAYELSPEILNDSRQSLWSVDVIPVAGVGSGGGSAAHRKSMASVELRPRLYPDPRLAYRQDDIAAASHPPLAACMVRLAEVGKGASPEGREVQEVIWDPFCGSGLELIESALRGGVDTAYGTDLDDKAIEVARANFAAARLEQTKGIFTVCDFRDARREAEIAAGSISLIISNPPLGRRVRIPDMKGLFADFYTAAARALRIGGRLVFVNPLRTGPEDPSLKLEFQKTVDLGGFNCRLEMYRKVVPHEKAKQSLTRHQKGPLASNTQGKPREKGQPDPAWWSRVGKSVKGGRGKPRPE
jgi:23S rRNA G2445 N2-methylase RlmL